MAKQNNKNNSDNKIQNTKNNDKTTSRNTAGARKSGLLPLLPLAFVLLVVPLIVFLKFSSREDLGLQDSVLFNINEWCVTDLFLYYKGLFFVIAAGIMILVIIYQGIVDSKKLSFAKLFIPLASYMLLAFLSSCVSVNKAASFKGGYQQYESIWVLLGYGIVTYYAAIFVRDVEDTKKLLVFLTISTIILLIIGGLQLLSKDIFQSEAFTRFAILGIPKEYRDYSEARFGLADGRVYMTLYNPNYVGSYASLLSPVFLMLALNSKKAWKIILNLGIFAGLLFTLLASGSRAGFIGVAAAIVLVIIIFNKKLLRFWSEALIVAVLMIGIVYTMNNYTNNGIINRFKSALTSESIEHSLNDIETNDDNLVITYNNEKAKIYFHFDLETQSYSIVAYDDKDNVITLDGFTDTDREKYFLCDSRFSDIRLYFAYIMDYPGLVLEIEGHEWYFVQYENSLYHFNDKYNLVKLDNSETFEPLAKHADFASRRGFIWSKTIPLLKDYVVVGSGPDTFTEVYPNLDYVDQYNAGYLGETMTKPHNMFLQIAVQTGLLSLLCVLAFYAWYFFSTLVLVMKSDKSSFSSLISIGILCGTFGYMVVGIINDSCVAVAPLFWALMGIGIANNGILKREKAVIAEVKN